MSNEMVPVQAGQTARQDFGGAELTVRGETAAVAVAAQAKAAVEARYILAMKRPRDLDEVRVRLLKECKRPSFAAVARYEKPVGKDKSKWPKGPSIRFAEAALRCMGNAMPETTIIFESDEQRIVQVTVTDLESNLTYSSQIVIAKTVERKFVKDGQTIISTRKNSYGDDVHLVQATEDDLLNKQNALISKAMRTHALRILPGDIVDECMTQVLETMRSDIKEDPDRAKKKLIDAFADLNVQPIDLTAFLGHSLDRIQPVEIEELRVIYAAIKDSETTWDDVMESRETTGSAEQQQEVRDKMAQRRGFASAAAAEEATKKPAATSTVPVTAQPVNDKPPAEGEPKWEVDEKQPEATPEPKGQGSMSFQRRNK